MALFLIKITYVLNKAIVQTNILTHFQNGCVQICNHEVKHSSCFQEVWLKYTAAGVLFYMITYCLKIPFDRYSEQTNILINFQIVVARMLTKVCPYGPVFDSYSNLAEKPSKQILYSFYIS